MYFAGLSIQGLCYSDGCLYAGEQEPVGRDSYKYSVAIYRVQGDHEDIRLMDRLELEGEWEGWFVQPRVERHSRRVFVACYELGVSLIVHLRDADRLVREKSLNCVRNADKVDVIPPDNAYVLENGSNVHVVDVRDDRIISTLEKLDPDIEGYGEPNNLVVLGDSVMVGYSGGCTVAVYHHGSPTPVSVITHPEELYGVFAVFSTDWQRHFLVTNRESNRVFVMDTKGNLRHTVDIDTDSSAEDCIVVNGQLWAGCRNGDIVIMSAHEVGHRGRELLP